MDENLIKITFLMSVQRVVVEIRRTWTEDVLAMEGAIAAAAWRPTATPSPHVVETNEILCLPGRTRLETLNVGPGTRKCYLAALWLPSSFVMEFSKGPHAGSPLLTRLQAVSFLVGASADDLVMDDMLAGCIHAAF